MLHTMLQVLGEVHPMTGRLTYRGKVMNRAARIASTASTGQVLCSTKAWNAALDVLGSHSSVTATSLGKFRLKGVAELIEIFHCRMAIKHARRSSVVDRAACEQWTQKMHSAVPPIPAQGLPIAKVRACSHPGVCS